MASYVLIRSKKDHIDNIIILVFGKNTNVRKQLAKVCKVHTSIIMLILIGKSYLA